VSYLFNKNYVSQYANLNVYVYIALRSWRQENGNIFAVP